MAHHIYQTEGFVLGSSPSGEANKQLDIFTRELGLVRVRAQALRKLQSKLRYSLQDFSLSTVALVRGKEVWRLTNASIITDFYHSLERDEEKRLLARITLILRRLLNGEERNEELFDIFKDGLIFLSEHRGFEKNLRNFEYVFVVRILNILGYWGNHEEYKKFTENNEWSENLVQEMAAYQSKAAGYINVALKESQL